METFSSIFPRGRKLPSREFILFIISGYSLTIRRFMLFQRALVWECLFGSSAQLFPPASSGTTEQVTILTVIYAFSSLTRSPPGWDWTELSTNLEQYTHTITDYYCNYYYHDYYYYHYSLTNMESEITLTDWLTDWHAAPGGRRGGGGSWEGGSGAPSNAGWWRVYACVCVLMFCS